MGATHSPGGYGPALAVTFVGGGSAGLSLTWALGWGGPSLAPFGAYLAAGDGRLIMALLVGVPQG